MRRTKRITSASPLTWADVVDLARDVQLHPAYDRGGAAGAVGTGGYPMFGEGSGALAVPAVAPALAAPAPAPVEDLLRALHLVGNFSEGEVQQYVDQVINVQ